MVVRNLGSSLCAVVLFCVILFWQPTQVFAEDLSLGKGSRRYITPTELVSPDRYPRFIDDLNFEEMDLVLSRQLRRYAKRSLRGSIRLGDVDYPLTRIKETLEAFRKLANGARQCVQKSSGYFQKRRCQQSFNNHVIRDYNVFMPKLSKDDPRYGEREQAFFTGYYTPLIEVSSVKTSEFRYPIYKNPGRKGKKRAIPSREQIDFEGALENQGHQIAYGRDLFELYLLHVEGGGRISYSDKGRANSKEYISYAGTNRKPWKFISIYMREQGYIDNGSIIAQKHFLREHPELEREIYRTCPSYVFFETTVMPPLGSDSVSLSDRRSIATDDELYRFKGMLSFITSRRVKEGQEKVGDNYDPDAIEYQDFSRFFLDQDTGGAIVGKARADIYFGEGQYAEFASSNMTQKGNIYFLLLKDPSHK